MSADFGARTTSRIDLAEIADFNLGGLHVSPARREVTKDGRRQELEPRVMQVFVALAQASPDVVSRDRLIEQCWDGRIVGDDALNRCIVALRRLAREFAPEPFALETVPRVGYSLVENRSAAVAGSSAAIAPRPETPRGRVLRHGKTAAFAAFALALLLAGVGAFLLSGGRGVTPAPAGAIAVAVLPFTNLSPDPRQDFFSDGITEEIGAALARIPNVHVVARSSAFAFKDQKKDIQAITGALHATHLIDGSVRKDGDQIRITAQLIAADTGLQVWSNSYDRQLVNVFAVQQDIAQAIAGALRIPLGLAPGKALLAQHEIDAESYQQFLRAKALVRERRNMAIGLPEAIGLLEPIVARYPDFAPAWAQLALAYPRMPNPLNNEFMPLAEKRRAADEWLPKAQAAAERAIALDPSLPDGYASLGLIMSFRGRLSEAEDLLMQALERDPFYPEALHTYGVLLGAVGRIEDGIALKRRLISIEPFVPVYPGGLGVMLWSNGDIDEAVAQFKANRELPRLAALYSTEGRHAEAADVLRNLPPADYPAGMLSTAVRIMRDGPADAALARRLPRFHDWLQVVYFRSGVPERALELMEEETAAGNLVPLRLLFLWTPMYEPLRNTGRFKDLVRDAGLVAYWRAKGWPSYCRPAEGEDFVCH